jgi:HPt (histidine-containing phosphotransfer) domain-containing protein
MQAEHTNQSEMEHIESAEKFETEIDNDSLIDFEVLSVLNNHGADASFLFYLLNLFEKHGLQSLNQLRDGMMKLDAVAVHHVAHRWRGSCLNVGASKLAEVLRQIEECPINEKTDLYEMENLWDYCENLFQKSCEQLRKLTPEQTPS